MWTYVTALIVALPLFDGLIGLSDLVLSSELQSLLQEWLPLIGALSAYILMWLVTRQWASDKAAESTDDIEKESLPEDLGTVPTPHKQGLEKPLRAPTASPVQEEDGTHYPDGYVFASNHVNSADELEKLRRETTQTAMRELFRSEEWRAHLRERGREESAYNWQRRQSLSSSDSRPCH